MKRVVVVSGEKVKMGTSLDDALDAVFGSGTGAPIEGGTTPPPTTGVGATLIQQALQHLQAADEALRRGDLAAYQREVNAAKAALEQANRGASPSPTPRAG